MSFNIVSPLKNTANRDGETVKFFPFSEVKQLSETMQLMQRYSWVRGVGIGSCHYKLLKMLLLPQKVYHKKFLKNFQRLSHPILVLIFSENLSSFVPQLMKEYTFFSPSLSQNTAPQNSNISENPPGYPSLPPPMIKSLLNPNIKSPQNTEIHT